MGLYENKKKVLEATKGKEIKSGLTGNRDGKMTISYNKASGKKVYRAKLK
jgi:hypothetical protein